MTAANISVSLTEEEHTLVLALAIKKKNSILAAQKQCDKRNISFPIALGICLERLEHVIDEMLRASTARTTR